MQKRKCQTHNSDGHIRLLIQLIVAMKKDFTIQSDAVTIIILDENCLDNDDVQNLISEYPNADLIIGAVCRMTTEEVNDIVLEKGSHFRKVYKSNFNTAYGQLCEYLSAMDKERDGTFSRQMVKDDVMCESILLTLQLTSNRYAKDSGKLNYRDVMIIENPGIGQSIADACHLLNECYSPKSITVVTLL